MNEREMLDAHERRIRRRLRGNLLELNDELERVIGPTVREYPRTSLIAGASAGFVAGRVAGAAAGGSRGALAAGFRSLLGGSGVAALRSTLNEVFRDGDTPQPEESPDEEA